MNIVVLSVSLIHPLTNKYVRIIDIGVDYGTGNVSDTDER